MQQWLDLEIYYDSKKKQWSAEYKHEQFHFPTILELLTFVGKKALHLQNEVEYQYIAENEELKKLFS